MVHLASYMTSGKSHAMSQHKEAAQSFLKMAGTGKVHIFRFEQGRIAELWDLAQPISTDSPNENGMF